MLFWRVKRCTVELVSGTCLPNALWVNLQPQKVEKKIDMQYNICKTKMKGSEMCASSVPKRPCCWKAWSLILITIHQTSAATPTKRLAAIFAILFLITTPTPMLCQHEDMTPVMISPNPPESRGSVHLRTRYMTHTWWNLLAVYSIR